MNQEDKDLLLKDLCTRLPYGTKVKTPYNDAILVGIINRKGFRKDIEYIDIVTDKQTYPIRYIQPYLRPMLSMTEEEKIDYQAFFNYDGVEYPDEYIDWLNAHHFDYRGLIEKGLAIAITEEDNPYEE